MRRRQLVQWASLASAALAAPTTTTKKAAVAPSKAAAYAAALDAASYRPCVVLARPHDPGNIGAAARAMLNFGLPEMRVVQPASATWRTDPEAAARSCGAIPIIEAATEYSALPDAVADVGLLLATTARPRDSTLPVLTPREAAVRAVAAIQKGTRVGLLFGSEKNGLSADEMLCASAIVTIPTDPLFSSLNLAQAILLVAYELQLAAEPSPRLASADEAEAPLGQLESLTEFVEDALHRGGFFGGGGEAKARAVMRKLRELLARASPSASELSLLRGVLQSMSVSDGAESEIR